MLDPSTPKDRWPQQNPGDDVARDVDKLRRVFAQQGSGDTGRALTVDLILHEMAEKARQFVGADAAAIALEQEGEIVCRAVVGEIAPDLGSRIDSERGLTGACIQRRQLQICEDCSQDLRVDREACRRLGVQALVVLPLVDGRELKGILEVFLATPRKFDWPSLRGLEKIGRQIVNAVARAKEPPLIPEEKPPVPRLIADHARIIQDLQPPSLAGANSGRRRSRSNIASIVLLPIAACTLVAAVWWALEANPPSHPSNETEPAAGAVSVEAPRAPAATSPARKGSPKATNPQLSGKISARSDRLVIYEKGKVVFESGPVHQAATTEKIPDNSESSSARSSEGIQGGRLLHRPEPDYPEELKAQGVHGDVVLEIVVEKDGRVGSVRTIEGDPRLTEAAIAAVRQWQYEPFTVKGEPVQVQLKVTVSFGTSR